MLFSTCIKGHDLTQTDAYVYKDSGLRECRQCAMAKARVRDKRGGMGFVNHYISSTNTGAPKTPPTHT